MLPEKALSTCQQHQKHKDKRLKNKINLKLLSLILLSSSLLSLILTMIELSMIYNEKINAVEQQFISIEKNFKNTLSSHLWFIYPEGVKTILNTIYDMPYISFVSVTSKAKVVDAELGINLQQNQKTKTFLITLQERKKKDHRVINSTNKPQRYLF